MAKNGAWGSKAKSAQNDLRKMKREEAKRKKALRREQKRIKAEQKKASKWATKADKAWGTKLPKEEAQFTRKRSGGKWFGKLFKRESQVTLRNYYARIDRARQTVDELIKELRGAKDGKVAQSIVGRYIERLGTSGSNVTSALARLFGRGATSTAVGAVVESVVEE